MAKKFKKQSESVPFSLSRWFRKIATAEPSTFTISMITLSFAIFLFGGGLWTIINYATIQPSMYYNNQFLFLYPGLGNQFIADTVVAVALYVMGLIGMLAIYQSTKYVYKPRQAYMTLIVGVTLLLLAYLFLENSIYIKMNFS